jgi:hypothetical protein
MLEFEELNEFFNVYGVKYLVNDVEKYERRNRVLNIELDGL